MLMVVPMLRFLRSTMLWVLILPYLFIFVGAASNQLCEIANHDKFPVLVNEAVRVHFAPDANGLIDRQHCIMTAQTHLNVLGDVFDIGNGYYSIGDGFIFLGQWLSGFCTFVWISLVVKTLHRKATTNDTETTGRPRAS